MRTDAVSRGGRPPVLFQTERISRMRNDTSIYNADDGSETKKNKKTGASDRTGHKKTEVIVSYTPDGPSFSDLFFSYLTAVLERV